MNPPTIPFWLLVVLFSLIGYCIHVVITNFSKHRAKKLPPGPSQFQTIGMFRTSEPFHASLAKVSQTYGPLLSLKLGSKTMIVVSSPKIAKKFLHEHDLEFSGRLPVDAATVFDHHKLSIVWSPPQRPWRILRKVCKEHIFSSERLKAGQGLRQEKVQHLCNYVQECCINGQAINIGEAVFSTSLSLMWNTFFSVDFGQSDSISSEEIKEIVWCMQKTLSSPNLADFFPILKAVDPQRLKGRAKFYMGKLLDIIDGIIRRRVQERDASLAYTRKNDFLETLLDLNQQNEAVLSYRSLKHFLLDLVIAGSETSSSTVEWVMAELLRSPEIKSKARDEIMEIVGKSELVQESDISNLPYLQSLVKETFRLHPAAPLLGRKAESDTEIHGYMVPQNAEVMVNLWAMGRDPCLWPNPNLFLPERFMDRDIDVKGNHFELLPFGTGRRICPGLPLAHRVVHVMVASLLHKFDWKLEEEIKPEQLDMSEESALTLHKAVPLRAIPVRTTV
ncbi:cytochrome P450 76T24-like [Coffea arabica]|uniref:Cytochrome P450 76T24-like n=1 Tax=Coffea arabica TaxID=13443 RepID=A0A6P6W2V4_COFAR